jgi:hypothetical protein
VDVIDGKPERRFLTHKGIVKFLRKRVGNAGQGQIVLCVPKVLPQTFYPTTKVFGVGASPYSQEKGFPKAQRSSGKRFVKEGEEDF